MVPLPLSMPVSVYNNTQDDVELTSSEHRDIVNALEAVQYKVLKVSRKLSDSCLWNRRLLFRPSISSSTVTASTTSLSSPAPRPSRSECFSFDTFHSNLTFSTSSEALPTVESRWFEDADEEENPTIWAGRLNHFRMKRQQPKSPKRVVIKSSQIPRLYEVDMPTREQLVKASDLTVLGPKGKPIRFGDLVESQRTIVCFIRHFWCPQCQDYMMSIAKHANPNLLAKAGVKLIIISNGSPSMIQPYLAISKAPFQLYTDPTLKLYDVLGMNLKTLSPGLPCERGRYIEHGIISGITNVVCNAVRVGMPLLVNGGDIGQVGGEFIIGPGLKCSYAHRMTSTASHDSIQALMVRAGLELPSFSESEHWVCKSSWPDIHRSIVRSLFL